MGNRISSRTRTAYMNAGITLIGHIVQIILGFIIRRLFIRSLGVQFLGYNSVFQNILQMLNLADLGIGVAITSFLYKPLAAGDEKVIASLMYMYKKIYRRLGLIVLVIGILFSFGIQFIITDASCSIGFLRFLFYINLVGTVSTYYLAYKRTLLIANQKSYITSLIDMITYVVMSMLQITALIVMPNYILYISITVGKNIVSNIIVSYKCNQIFRDYNHMTDQDVLNQYKPKLFNYVKDVCVSRIGAYVFYSTDNIIISIFKGSLLAGYLSNYMLVTTQVNTVIIQILSAIQATFGNYINTVNDVKAQKQMTDNYFCINFCIGNFCMLCTMFLIQPFIELVFGAQFLLESSTVFFLTVNLLLTILIQIPSQVFMIYKLYHYDRPIIVISATTNIVLSCSLVSSMGINGVLIGTAITSLFYLFSRFYIISRKIYNVPYITFVLTIIKYSVIAMISMYAEVLVVRNIEEVTLAAFGIKMVLVAVTAIVVPSLCLIRTREFKFYVNKILSTKLRKLVTDKVIVFICITGFVLCASIGTMLQFQNTVTVEEGNKSFPRVDSYFDEISTVNSEKIFHLSFDDVIEVFADLTEKEGDYKSIFNNKVFSWFKELHEKYGVVITCYVFYESDMFALDKCTDCFKSEFEENADWLRFGFHSQNRNTIYGDNSSSIADNYNSTIAELRRIVGINSIDNVIRLHSYKASKKEVITLQTLEEEPIIGLLTADDLRSSYCLSPSDNEYIYCHDRLVRDGIIYFSTDLRAEYIENVDEKLRELKCESWNNQTDYMVIFSHEWQIDSEIQKKIEKLCEWAAEEEYSFKFLEDTANEIAK